MRTGGFSDGKEKTVNPFRRLWQKAAAGAENLIEGARDKAETFIVGTETYDDEMHVHGFYRRVSSDGETEMGFGFHCPVRGSSDPTKPLRTGAHITHCGKTDVLNTNDWLPTVRMKPRWGRFQIAADGTKAFPTDAFETFSGEVEYEPGDPGKGGMF
jgi:hypothetical protein